MGGRPGDAWDVLGSNKREPTTLEVICESRKAVAAVAA